MTNSLKKIKIGIACLTAGLFVVTSTVPAALAAEIQWNELTPGVMVHPSENFVPVLLKGLTLYPDDPLRFDFVVDSGSRHLESTDIQAASEKLVRYFMSGLTIPKSELWVNLSPYEGDRIITTALSRTELGQDMLIQDYLLKQLTSTLIYPEADLGKEFWNRVYAKAYAQYGISELPISTFNKVWILPDEAVIAETGNSVEIVKSTLKVMLDRDYVAAKNNAGIAAEGQEEELNALSSAVLRDLIVPEIEKEVNSGENFAALRQIFHSLILAKWYKETITNSLLTRVYVDQEKVLGVDMADPDIKEQVYQRYLSAFQIGVFDYVREEYDRYTDELIPRKYFSGGITQFMDVTLTRAQSGQRAEVQGDRFLMSIGTFPRYQGDQAVLSSSSQNIPGVREVRMMDQLFVKAQLERHWKPKVLVPMAEAVDALYEQLSATGTEVDRGAIENYLKNTPGYPVEGNIHLAEDRKHLSGVSKGLEGVGVGRATFFEREDVQFKYPFVAPTDTEELRDKKVNSEKRIVSETFETSFREETTLRGNAVYEAVIDRIIQHLHTLVDQRMEFAYRLVYELVRKSDADLRAELELDEQEVPDAFIDTLKKELVSLYIPRLVEAHATFTDAGTTMAGNYKMYQRLKLVRGAWAVLLTHPYGLDRLSEYYSLAEDYVTFHSRLDEELRKADSEKDTQRISRLRRELDRIGKRLQLLHEEVDGLQKSASAQQMMFFTSFLPSTLGKASGVNQEMNAHDMVRLYSLEIEAMFEGARERGWNRNFDALKEAFTAFSFVNDHLDSHSYVTAYTDSPEVKDLHIRAERQRFRKVMDRASTLFFRELVRRKAMQDDEINGKLYQIIVDGPDSTDELAAGLYTDHPHFDAFLKEFAAYVETRIEGRGASIESSVINYLAVLMDDDLNATVEGQVTRPEFADFRERGDFEQAIFQFIMLFSHTLKKETTKQITEPVVVFIDPNVEALTPNEVGTIHLKYPNIIAVVEHGRSPHAINQFPLSVSGVEGINTANIDETDLIIVQGSSKGVGNVLVRPDFKRRVDAYSFSEDLEKRREYFNIVAAKPIKIGGREYRSFVSLGVNFRDDLKKMATLGIPSVGLHRLELMFEDPYRPDLRNNERQMADEFEKILNEEVFSAVSGEGVVGLYIPRIDDVGGEKIPKILTDYLKGVEKGYGAKKKQEVEREILTKYSGTAFYFYRNEAGERPFYEYGQRQLRALFRAYSKAVNKRLGITFPNVKVIDGVVNLDDILGMIAEAKQRVAADLYTEEKAVMEENLDKLRKEVEDAQTAGDATEAAQRALDAKRAEVKTQQD
ncbi:MAG: hypothetical protein K8I00_13325, partial [Candidatus Omnitrophica bacterium]|nr:hypothetical protein [Candidatus Omnitrophota bacterium]